jgi:hypothetical protein
MKDIIREYEIKYEEQVLLSYNGKGSDELISHMIELAKNKLDKIESNVTLKKRVMHIIIEILQNIYHHKVEFSLVDYQTFVFYLFQKDNGYILVSGNYVPGAKTKIISDWIDHFSALSSIELKKAYRRQLMIGAFTHRGGAGLGLLDIIRKSNGNVDYKVVPVDKDYSFFLMEVKIGC